MTKDEAIEILEWQKEYQYESDVEAFDMAIEALKTEPVRHGHWITHPWAEIIHDHFVNDYECSECHDWQVFDTDYCPNCGAKMDEVKEE